MTHIIGIDPGSEKHSMVVLRNGVIDTVYNDLQSDQLFSKITNFLITGSSTVVIEDLAAYSLRLTPQVIDTAKWIGMAEMRLKMASTANVELIPRSLVKKWVFDTFDTAKSMCRAKVKKAVDKGKYAHREASFVYVDDKIVTECIKEYWNIPKPPPGSGYQFGLKEHSWQALAVATFHIQKSPQE